MTAQCKALDLAFLESEQAVSEGLIKKKMVVKNAYYGKISDGDKFPLRSGTRIKGQRLGRIVPPDCHDWQPVSDSLCATNMCDDTAEVISHGSDEFFFSLVKLALKTDWLCLDSLAVRDMPEEEIAHLEEGLQASSRYVHEEFRRSRYLHFGRNKMVTILEEDDDTGLPATEDVTSCAGTEQLNNGWLFPLKENDEIDQCHVHVACDPEKLGLIGDLSLDNLDYATERLEYEDEVYLDGTNLHDVLLASKRLANQLALAEDDKMNNATSQGGHNLLDLSQAFGTERVLRNYSLRSDIHAMRFYPDVTYNEALIASPGYAYDADDPNTWPRFVRVFPYRIKKGGVAGVDKITNENYLRAPFGISTILNTRVMKVMSFPEVTGFGSARKADSVSYEGVARWLNPDWPCNEDRNKGFWKMHFRMAAKPMLDELGYSWFHRLTNKLDFRGNRCAIPTATEYPDVTPYCYEGTGGDDAGNGGNMVNEVNA